MKGRTVLEFGAGVGTLTLQLAEEVGPGGKVYSTDLSESNIRIINKRLKKANIKHVEVIHDKHQVNRLHPDIQKVDAVVSVSMMSYLQDPDKVLREINQVLPEGGEIFFVEYVDFFGILPNAKWLSNLENIRNIFRNFATFF